MRLAEGRALIRAAWTLAIALVAVLFLKIFVCDVKHVESSSMEPWIFGSLTGGESVLVLYGSFAPERFDCAVIAREGEPVPIVKRIVGLPTESLQIANGDLFVDGKRLPPGARRPAPIPVYDSRLPSAAGAFVPAPGSDALWTSVDGGWSLDARSLAADSGDAQLLMHRPLTDGFLTQGGTLVRGEEDVNDAVLECDLQFREPRGRVAFELTEQGDVFRFTIEAVPGGPAIARIARRFAGSPEEVLLVREVPLSAGGWIHVRCSNVDNALAFEIADAQGGIGVPLCAEYEANRLDPADHVREGRAFGPRIRFGGEAGAFEFRSLRILRDLYYTARGTLGVTEPADLGPDEFFVLGDNSASSRDSREWGPVGSSRILGRPVWVVWPPARVRKLPPAVPGPCGR